MRRRRPVLTRWSLAAIIFAVASAGAVALFGTLKLHWPTWIAPTLVAALGVLAALSSFWAEAEISSALEHRKLRRQQKLRGELVFQQELGGRREPIRVRDADPLRLGVHAAISEATHSAQPSALPDYVARDFDQKLDGIIRLGVTDGVFVLLLGNSSVGKTRAAYESIRRVVPEWFIVQSRTPESLVALAESGECPNKTVIWLDEIQYYLNESSPVTAATIRMLLDNRHPIVIIGTIWPSVYEAHTDIMQPGVVSAHPANEVLKLAQIIGVDDSFSVTELERAEVVRKNDRRVDMALRATDFGFTQVLAAAPELIRRWKSAPDPYSRALLTAAIDARRLGLKHPLTRKLLKSAAPAYLSSMEQASAGHDWFEQSLAYATKVVRGSSAALIPVARGMGSAQGYVIADYLLEQGQRLRGSVLPPQQAWDAFRKHTANGEDLISLGRGAQNRSRLSLASCIFEDAIQKGEHEAYACLADLAEETGRGDEAEKILRTAVTKGVSRARSALIYRLQKSGRIEEEEQFIKIAVSEGDKFAHRRLAELLHRTGRSAEAESILRSRAAEGDLDAASVLVSVAKDKGDIGEAEAMLRSLILKDPSRHGNYRVTLAGMLEEQGRISEAEELLRSSVVHGETFGRRDLAEFLKRQDRLGEVEQVWREGVAANDDPLARFWLGVSLREQGREDEFIELLREPGSENALFVGPMLARFYDQKGEQKKAEEVWFDSINRGDGIAKIMYKMHLERERPHARCATLHKVWAKY